MITVPVTDVVPVCTSKVPLVEPDAIVIDAGTVASVALLVDNATTIPAAGAAAVSVIVPVTAAPPDTDVDEIEIALNAAAVDEGAVEEPPHAARTTHESARTNEARNGRPGVQARRHDASQRRCHSVAIDPTNFRHKKRGHVDLARRQTARETGAWHRTRVRPPSPYKI